MTDLTREQIDRLRDELLLYMPSARMRELTNLCDMALRSLSPAVPEGCVVPRDEDEWWEYYYLKEGWTTNDHD